MKSCIIGGYRGRFFKWDGNFLPTVESFLAPIWVHLPQFPLFLFNEKAILSVASVFGQPLFIDSSSWNRERVGKLSVCVARDVRVKGPNEILVEFVGNGVIVERLTQLVNYGEIPDYCTRCLHIGHCLEDCKVVSGIDKPLGPVSSRIKDGEIGDIPLSSIFDRIQVDLDKRHKEGDQLLKDCDKVLLADAKDDLEDCVLADRPSLLAEIPLQHTKISDSSKVPSLVPVESNQDLIHEPSDMILKVDDKALGADKFKDGEFAILGGKTNNAVQISESSSDSSVVPSSKSVFSNPGAESKGLVAGVDSLISKVDFSIEKNLDTDREEQVFAVDKSADVSKATGLLETNSDSPVAPSLEQDILIPGAATHNSLAGDLCTILKDDINTDQRLEKAGEGSGILPETSVVASPNAGLVLSKGFHNPLSSLIQDGSFHGRAGDVLLWLGNKVCSLLQENFIQQVQFQKAKVEVCKPSILASSAIDAGQYKANPSQSLEGVSISFAQEVLCHLKQVMLATPKPTQGHSSHHKVVIKHPVTKEVIQLTPKAAPLVSTAPKYTQGLNKNAKKKWKKNQKKMALQKSSSSAIPISIEVPEASKDHFSSVSCSPLPLCVTLQQDLEGIDSNGSKDSAFWINYHAAQMDLSRIERPEANPYMFLVDSEDEKISSTSNSQALSSPSESQVLPSSMDTTSSDSSTQRIDVQALRKAYQKAADSIDNEVIERSQEQLDLVPLMEAYQKGHFDVQVDSQTKHSWAEEVEASTPLSFDEISGAPVVKSFKPASKKYHKEQFEPP